MMIFLNEGDDERAIGTKVEAFSIEATLPELQSLAAFFKQCAAEVEEKMAGNNFYLEGDLPDYVINVPEIVVTS